jgi:hypothetical protein
LQDLSVYRPTRHLSIRELWPHFRSSYDYIDCELSDLCNVQFEMPKYLMSIGAWQRVESFLTGTALRKCPLLRLKLQSSHFVLMVYGNMVIWVGCPIKDELQGRESFPIGQKFQNDTQQMSNSDWLTIQSIRTS